MFNLGHTTQSEHLIDGVFIQEMSPTAPGGPATPLLMIHGAMHGAWAWNGWMPFFATAGWRCFALSLRNHPGSRAVPADTFLRLTAADYVQDVLTAIKLMPRPPVLVGHSMGSIIAQKVAETTEVAGLVLMCGSGPGQLGKLRDPLPLDTPLVRKPEDIRTLYFREIDDRAFADYHPRLVPESPGVVNHCNDGTLEIDPARIACPVLVMAGERDAIPLHPAPAIAEFYGADLLTIPGGSHIFFMESPALPAAVRLNEWLLHCVDGPLLAGPHGMRHAMHTAQRSN